MSTHLPYKTIIFDLDGTLIDTWPSLLGAIQAVAPDDARHLELPALRRQLSHSIQALFTLAAHQFVSPQALQHDLMAQIANTYQKEWLCRAHPYDGVGAMLENLHEDGFRLGLCTNRDRASTRLLLAALGWENLFAESICLGESRHAKPHPQPLQDMLARFDSNAWEALFVGDSSNDAVCAAEAGVAFAAHRHGYHLDAEELQPQVMAFGHHHELEDWLRQEKPLRLPCPAGTRHGVAAFPGTSQDT